MRRVVFNQKGGVGKSSITVNLAAISAARGKRTLVVDLDPQCNSTHYLLGDEANSPDTDIRDFFESTLSFQLKPADPQSYVHQTPFDNLWLIPSHPDLGDLQSKLESKHKIYKLREALETLLENFDAIYIDTPPAFNFFTLSALCAAERCLIPFDCDDFARQALYSLLNNVQETQADHNETLAVEGIVVNQYQPRASLPQKIVEELLAESLPVLKTRIPASVKMKESHTAAKPLIQLAPKHRLTAEFVNLYEELHPE
ncbi:Chromosome partitioning protein ParA [Marinobacterium lacunae]|uniref:Chromosome partitioning protein ParA n=1 Tax=Marinobacterium lacunae TaxID=1232683 RepID=A0A081G433_9GAMM|nr:ParA family protein [Marinobacterium lacunae]KEA65538.1 Chromosome partitioning protein ParA [Marinobacterium lacunae]